MPCGLSNTEVQARKLCQKALITTLSINRKQLNDSLPT
jgi:hypothetical protein